MNADVEPAGVKVVRGLVAGVVAGAVASFVMDRVQAAVTALSPPSDDHSDPATVKAVAGIVGHDVPEAVKPLAGQTMHYLLGIGLGAAYGIAAEFRPEVTAGYGAGFAIGSATLLDQVAVPAVGLGEPVWQASPITTAYSYLSHAVFGGVTELVRRQVRATLVLSS